LGASVIERLGGRRLPDPWDPSACAFAKRYKDYDARQLNQWIDEGKACTNGIIVTYNTS
jgi:hypothetical protein